MHSVAPPPAPAIPLEGHAGLISGRPPPPPLPCSAHALPLGSPVLDISPRWTYPTGVLFRLASSVTVSLPRARGAGASLLPVMAVTFQCRTILGVCPSAAGRVGCPTCRVRKVLLRFGEHDPSTCWGVFSGGAAASAPEELVGETRGPEAQGARLPTSRGFPGGGLRLPSRACALPREVSRSHRAEAHRGLAASPRLVPRERQAVTFGTVISTRYCTCREA